MTDAASKAIKFPNRYHIKAALVGISYEAVQFRSPLCCAGDSGVHALRDESPAASLAVFA